MRNHKLVDNIRKAECDSVNYFQVIENMIEYRVFVTLVMNCRVLWRRE